MKRIELLIPLSKEAIISARLVATAIATNLNYSLEQTEDIKLLASEGLNILSAYNFCETKVVYLYDVGLKICFEGKGQSSTKEVDKEACAVSKLLIEGLSHSYNLNCEQGIIEIQF